MSVRPPYYWPSRSPRASSHRRCLRRSPGSKSLPVNPLPRGARSARQARNNWSADVSMARSIHVTRRIGSFRTSSWRRGTPGKVEYVATFSMMMPVALSKASGVLVTRS